MSFRDAMRERIASLETELAAARSASAERDAIEQRITELEEDLAETRAVIDPARIARARARSRARWLGAIAALALAAFVLHYAREGAQRARIERLESDATGHRAELAAVNAELGTMHRELAAARAARHETEAPEAQREILRGRVSDSQRGSVEVGEACNVSFEWHRSGSACQMLAVCGDRLVYGGPFAGELECDVSRGHVTTAGSPAGGLAVFYLARLGRLTVLDGASAVTIELDPLDPVTAR